MRSRTFALRNRPHGTANLLFQMMNLERSPRAGPNRATLYITGAQVGLYISSTHSFTLKRGNYRERCCNARLVCVPAFPPEGTAGGTQGERHGQRCAMPLGHPPAIAALPPVKKRFTPDPDTPRFSGRCTSSPASAPKPIVRVAFVSKYGVRR